MIRGFFYYLWLILYWFYIERTGEMTPGAGRRAVTLLLACLLLGAALAGAAVSGRLVGWLGFAAVTLLFLLYDCFFDRAAFRHRMLPVLAPGVGICLLALLEERAAWPGGRMLFLVNGPLLFGFFALSAAQRGYLSLRSAASVGMAYLLLSALLWQLLFSGHVSAGVQTQQGLALLITALQFLLLFLMESTLFAYKKGFEFRTERFQKEVLEHQYAEIKAIYMNMRGWRHDYHNHIQVLKAYLAAGSIEEVNDYLNRLEQDLDRVDTYVKSGNPMIDAILNSKLTLAAEKQVAVNCKAQAPETLAVEDVDLCVILGNLLDNALEACEAILPKERFLRVYLAVLGSQFYLSIQNSSREDLSEGERSYITNKRGNHGYGMRRGKAAVDKYDGFLNLANEPGVFAAEVTLPLARG